jgi:hypothetical protein
MEEIKMRDGQDYTPVERDALMHDAKIKQERQLPSAGKMAGNLAKAVVKHVGDGLRKVDVKGYQDRLDICNECQLRVKNRCTHESCGCFLDKKAWWASEECPLDKWFGV